MLRVVRDAILVDALNKVLKVLKVVKDLKDFIYCREANYTLK